MDAKCVAGFTTPVARIFNLTGRTRREVLRLRAHMYAVLIYACMGAATVSSELGSRCAWVTVACFCKNKSRQLLVRALRSYRVVNELRG